MQIRAGKTIGAAGLDPLDARIVAHLRSTPRATNQEIAERLSVTAATVSSRLRRLDEAKAMRVVAVTDFAALGYNVIIALGVKVRGRGVREVGRDLAEFPEVLSVNIMNGEMDLELLVALHDFAEIQEFLYDHIAGVEGVAHIEAGIAADIVKFEFNVAPL